jgi:ArsR family transcriptional regulator
MQVAFPVETDQGMRSPVYNHFGSAPIFIIIDSETYAAKLIQNADLNHIQGQCRPLAALQGVTVDAVVAGGIGRGALNKLRTAGIQVFTAAKGSVGENLALFNEGQLTEFPANQICVGHGIDRNCAH